MDTEKLLQQYEKYCSILSKVIPEDQVDRLTSEIGERLAVSARGLTKEDGGTPGGLIEFSLRVASAAKSVSDEFGPASSLVKVALLHDIGRVGGLEAESDLYLPQTSDWHRDKLGQFYKYNDKCPKMNIAHRSLWLLSHFGINLSREEWVAINVAQGMHLPENQFYGNSLNNIAAGLLASRLVVLHGK